MGTQIKYHLTERQSKIAEILPESDRITGPEDILDILADVGYNKCNRIIIHDKNLNPDFFNLKTRVAGEILQKFSNYRMRLALVGDFAGYKSKSLRDFIWESNKMGMVFFVSSIEEALSKLNK